MQKICIVSTDGKMSSQVRSWLRSLDGDPYVQTFSNITDFKKKYANPLIASDEIIDSPQSGIEKSGAEREKELAFQADSSVIKLLILDLDTLEKSPLDQIIEVVQNLKDLGHFAAQGSVSRSRLLLLGYDNLQSHPEHFRHEIIDDMQLKPLDQQLFLQKCEFLLSVPESFSPTFLFRATTQETIEAGKDSIVEEVSEFAISIRNPAPLAEGVFAVVHLAILGPGTQSRILCRSFAAVRHPHIEKAWMNRLTFFGLSNDQLAAVRKFLRGRLANTPKSNVSGQARKRDKQPPRHRVAVVDMDRDILASLQANIDESFDKIGVTSFISFSRLLGELIKLSGDTNGSASQLDDARAEETSFPLPRFDFILDNNLSIVKTMPSLGDKQDILGLTLGELKRRGPNWIDIIPKVDHDDIHDFLNYARSSGRAVTTARFVDTQGSFAYAEIKAQLEKGDASDELAPYLRLELRSLDRESFQEINRKDSKGLSPEALRFDLLIIDGSLIRGDLDVWLSALHEAMIRARVLFPKDPLPQIIVMADEKSGTQPDRFAHKGIADFIYKPIDRKLFSDKIATLNPHFTRVALPADSPFVSCELTAQLCKAVQMTELSEYGLSITLPSPLRPNVFMKFFSELFEVSSNGVIGRCTHVMESEASEGKNAKREYACHFTFFGATDDLHKSIRNWIREDYVHKKESKG